MFVTTKKSMHFLHSTRGCSCPSAAPTEQSGTNITILPQIAKNFWRKIFSHRLHGCAQIRRQKRNLKICEHL